MVFPLWLLKASRAHRHTLHRASQAEAHLPPLVPPHHCLHLLLVLLHPHDCHGAVVHGDELLRALLHVRILRPSSWWDLQTSKMGQHVYHHSPTPTNGWRCDYQRSRSHEHRQPRLLLRRHHRVLLLPCVGLLCHVWQLFFAVPAFLLRHLLHQAGANPYQYEDKWSHLS